MTADMPAADQWSAQPQRARPAAPPHLARRAAVTNGTRLQDRPGVNWGDDPSVGKPSLRQHMSRLPAIPHHVRWAAAGFAAGALFWHFVGFWTFMSQIMFSSPETASQLPRSTPSRAASSSANGAAAPSPIETGSLRRLEKLTTARIEASCTAVARDPHSGGTRQSDCRKLARAFAVKSDSTRQDRPAARQPQAPTAEAFKLPDNVPLEWPQTARNP
jgi:hypothetical protein